MARLSLTPPIPLPVPASLGGTGVANPAGATLTLSGTVTITDVHLGALTLQGTSSGAELQVAAGKTHVVNASLTLNGTDGTTMTFPGASDTVAGLGTIQTFTAAQTISLSAGTGLIVTSADTTGPIMQVNATGLTSAGGLGFVIRHTNTTFNNPLLWVKAADGSGSFGGWLAYLANNGTVKFNVLSGGNTTIAGSLSVGTGNGGFDTTGKLLLGLEGAGAATGTATLGRIPTGKTTTAMTSWAIGVNAGTQYRWPVWIDT